MSSPDDLIHELISGDESRAEDAALRLAQLGESVVPALAVLLASANADHRWWAVRTLAQMPNVNASYFIEGMQDNSHQVRQAAALALAAHPAQEAVPLLIGALSDDDGMLAGLSANSLLALGKSVVPVLVAALPSSPLAARIQIIRVLAELRDPRAIPAMMQAMDEDSAILHHWAEVGLQQLGLDMVYIKLS